MPVVSLDGAPSLPKVAGTSLFGSLGSLFSSDGTHPAANVRATVLEAAIEGSKVRFRPILMTSFAFIAGLIPLAIATGPGAIGNRTIGTSALGGMLFGTVFGVIIVPGLYFIFGTLAEGRSLIGGEEDEPLTEDAVHHAHHHHDDDDDDDE